MKGKTQIASERVLFLYPKIRRKIYVLRVQE
uniref:Uncharacterized protein n=1 Tax=Siphoviridae sp. ctL0q1 TaxID=2825449 RepID=A0A8S5PIK0_9CAUD|nr:MAG TPA: hypothetical protein [Siphoviridae sp. ctL0q1]